MATTEISTGKLLVAEPFMEDPNFRRSVVLLCEHNDLGSLGFILNNATGTPFMDLFDDFAEIGSSYVGFGGPVQTNTLHYIHNKGQLLEDSIPIGEGLYWGGDFEQLRTLSVQGLIKAYDIRFFVGYSGWSAGQLADEIAEGSWMVTDLTPSIVLRGCLEHEPAKKSLFSEPGVISEIWSKVLTRMGGNFTLIADLPEVEELRN